MPDRLLPLPTARGGRVSSDGTTPNKRAINMNRMDNRIRLPEYTGGNRCLPCTIVNLVIAAVVSGLMGLVSVSAGFGSFVAFVAIIYLRGYLVPGTPTFTKRYVPDRVLQWFDKEPMPTYAVDADSDDELDVEAVLLGACALEESANPGDLVLTSTFEEEWNRRIDRLDRTTTKEMLAEILDIGQSQVRMEDHPGSYLVVVDGKQVGRWGSKAAFDADIAAGITLAERIDGWDDLTVEKQTGLMRGVRVFLKQCPDCGGPVTMTEETVESCCSSREVLASTCQDCGVRLFEMNAAKVEWESP